MRVIVLTAGEGVRLRPLTETQPKGMLPVANQPILEHIVTQCALIGLEEFTFVVGYQAQIIEDYFQDGARWGVHIEYASQRKQLGTAHALNSLPERERDRFLVINGDSLLKASDIGRIAASESICMGVIEHPNPRHLGVVETQGENVIRILEKVDKPPSNLANAGLYLFTPDIFDAVARTPRSARGEYEITDSLQMLINEGKTVRCVRLSYWRDLSYPWDLLEANESLLKDLEGRNLGTIEPGATVKGPVSIGENTTVRAGAYIVGPVIIGANCDIGPNCFIRPSTAIADDCHIGHSVEIKNSIIMRGAKVPHLNYVGDSVVGRGCNLGAGTVIANLRLDKGPVQVLGRDTQRVKFGAILGDSVQTGINASINVGSLVGSETFIGPGAVASGVIDRRSRLF
ncbi:MAG: NTP transferase domain-containing protein [Chloroflexi bacterium]|nr:NTP transferase domain-containing protein [Chloroflexota bacterium]